jgi:hypothetical protein
MKGQSKLIIYGVLLIVGILIGTFILHGAIYKEKSVTLYFEFWPEHATANNCLEQAETFLEDNWNPTCNTEEISANGVYTCRCRVY